MYNTGNSSKNVTTTSIVDGTISNADVDASAAIAQSKLATLVITDSEVANDALSVNKIDGGTISGSVTLVTPDIGTPSAGVLTNCSGTASSLTAGNVTTNANLTGVVTSTRNATAIAADAISGDKIDGGTISDFASLGIDDNATGTIMYVEDSDVRIGTSSQFSDAKVSIDVAADSPNAGIAIGPTSNTRMMIVNPGAWIGDGDQPLVTAARGHGFFLIGQRYSSTDYRSEMWMVSIEDDGTTINSNKVDGSAGAITGTAFSVDGNGDLAITTSVGASDTTVFGFYAYD